MAQNNLRVIYNNLADYSGVAVSASSEQNSTTTPATNLLKNAKGRVWRSSPTTIASTTVSANLLIDLGSAKSIGGVVLAFTNLNSNTATIRVTGYSTPPTLTGSVDTPTVTGGTQVGSFQQTTTCCPWNTLALPNWAGTPATANMYAYGGGTYARVWLSTAIQALQARYVLLEITDAYSTSASGRYIEASRIIIGPYWSPKYNTSYGITSAIKDLSTHSRTESGDLVSTIGPRFNSLSFDMKWLSSSTDKVELTRMLQGGGLPRPVLISLFPDYAGGTTGAYETERNHMVFGKLTQIPGTQFNPLDLYSTQIEIEEI